MGSRKYWALGLAAAPLLAAPLLLPASASAQEPGGVPTYRSAGTTLLVCGTDPADFTQRLADFSAELVATNQTLWTQCQTTGVHSLQEAVDRVTTPGVIIKILPGEYVGGPEGQSLATITDMQNLQVEGTGAAPDDVVLDAQFRAPSVIDAQRTNGLYLRNLSAQHATANAITISGADGFAVDTVIGRWNNGDGVRAVTSDHGLVTACETYGNGEAGIAAADLPTLADRYSIEITGCQSHHNLQGYLGTGANSVWAHDNTFLANSVGVATGSAAQGRPQHHALFENNVIGVNNSRYYGYVRDGTCARPAAERDYEAGVVCPAVGVPPGTGVLDPGGDDNTWRGNWIYGNDYAGFVNISVPGVVHGDLRISAQIGTPHRDRYDGNHLGRTPDGTKAPNGIDIWWDGQGVGSCWQADVRSEPLAPPSCADQGGPVGAGTARYVAEPAKLLKVNACARYDLASATVPGDCEWYGAQGLSRAEVKSAVGEATVLGLVIVIVWWRLLRRWGFALVGVLLTVGGHVVVVLGTVYEASWLAPLGLNLLGAGWVVLGVMLHRAGRPGLGFLTAALGTIALVGAVDRGIWMLPYLPVPPSLWRIALEACWVPAAVVAAMRGRIRRVPAKTRPRRSARAKRTGDPLEDFTAILRS